MFKNYLLNKKLFKNLANAILSLAFIYSLLILIYSIYRIIYPHHSEMVIFYYFYLLIGLILITFFITCLKYGKNLFRIYLSFIIIIFGISIYLIETYLDFKKWGVDPLNQITIWQYYKEVQKDGTELYPHFRQHEFTKENGLNTISDEIYTLGGISNVALVLTNENGYYPVIENDEYGFNNIKGLYKKDNIDIALVGDGIIQGYSVNQNESIGAVLREKSGLNVVSLGLAPNGPLHQLATLKEYAEPFKPKIVLWAYNADDLFQVKSEINTSILNKYYTNSNFSQNLINRQKEIDEVQKNYALKVWDGESSSYPTRSIRIFKLSEIRSSINMHEDKQDLEEKRVNMIKNSNNKEFINNLLNEQKLLEFREIMKKSKKLINSWNGKMYFVYVTPRTAFEVDKENIIEDVIAPTEEVRAFLFKTMNDLDIPIIDTQSLIFDDYSDWKKLYGDGPFHLNAAGYKLVAESINNRIIKDQQ